MADKQELIEQLQEGIRDLTSSEQWEAWLRMQRRFHKYSFGNTLLIALQRPDATRVAGFHTWKSVGRSVRKGEKGIAIFAPIVRRTRVEDEDGKVTVIAGTPATFRLVYIFDVAQTDGEELMTSPVTRLQGDAPGEVYDLLLKTAASIGYTVELAELPGERNGDCDRKSRIRIREGLEPAQAAKTLAHELAHAILHGSDLALDRERAELEAESVAFIVCAELDIDSSQYSFGYVASWAGGGDEAIKGIAESGQRIAKAAKQILAGGLDETATGAVEAA